MLLEVIVACVLLGTLLTVCVQLLSAAAAQRVAADHRQRALAELANVMERVSARPWAEVTDAAMAQEKLSPQTVDELPGATLKIEVFSDAKQPDAKRITATLGWEGRNGQPLAPVSLTTWRYKIEPVVPDSKPKASDPKSVVSDPKSVISDSKSIVSVSQSMVSDSKSIVFVPQSVASVPKGR